MKNHRVVVTAHGGPDVLKVIEEDLPEPGEGEVRLRVLAAGVSAYDAMLRSSGALPGTPRVPYTPGEDVVGVVDELGEGVSTSNRDSAWQPLPSATAAGTPSPSAGPPSRWCLSPEMWIPPRPSAWW